MFNNAFKQTNSEKVGRNEPCPCGSGKKYKACCYINKTSHPNVDPDWLKIRQTEGELIDKILKPYVESKYGWEIVQLAEISFFMGIELPQKLYDAFLDQLFVPWFLFRWIPPIAGLPNQTIAKTYLQERGYQLTSYQRGFMEAQGISYASFYQVTDVEFEKSVSLRDLILGTEHKIKEVSGTHYFKKGNIIYSRILSYNDQEINIGIAPMAIPTNGHMALIDWMTEFKRQSPGISFTPEVLVENESDLREICITSLEAAFRPPVLTNTDGDLYELCELIFTTTGGPEEILDKIIPMALFESKEEILEQAERNRHGHITEINFAWHKKGNKMHKDWDNTVMGHLTIKQGLLNINVNSQKRAKKARQLVEKYLGNLAQFSSLKVSSADEELREKKPKTLKKKQINEDLMNSAEVLEFMTSYMEDHWNKWLDMRIPILDDMTPREAALDEVGRQKLEALLLDFETDKGKQPELAPDVNKLRQQLGLAA